VIVSVFVPVDVTDSVIDAVIMIMIASVVLNLNRAVFVSVDVIAVVIKSSTIVNESQS
jgi:hypothetical protein